MRNKREPWSFLLLVLLGIFLIHLSIPETGVIKSFDLDTAWAQEPGKGEQDSHYIQLMKQLKIKVDDWLKDINQRIEKEDVTRFEVRFLEILRSLLEWIGEKIESQIEAGEKKPKKRTRGEDI